MPVHPAGPGKLYTQGPDGEWVFLGEVDSWEFTFVKPGARSGEDTSDSSWT